WHSPEDDESRALRELPRVGPAGAGAATAEVAGTGRGKMFVFDGEAASLHPFEQARGGAIEDIAAAREAGAVVQWLGVNGALWAWDGEHARAASVSEGLRSLWISKLLATPRDRERDDLWVGLNSTGLSHRKSGAWENLTARDGIDDNETVTTLFADRGALWVGLQAAGARRLS